MHIKDQKENKIEIFVFGLDFDLFFIILILIRKYHIIINHLLLIKLKLLLFYLL
jgi:hypothetical protein